MREHLTWAAIMLAFLVALGTKDLVAIDHDIDREAACPFVGRG